MKKLCETSGISGGGYSSPDFFLLEMTLETGFAASMKNWNDGTISDTKNNYNIWESL